MFLTILVVIMVGFQGCTKTWTEKTVVYQAPNWTSDGRVVFIENIWIDQHEKKFLFPQNGWQINQELWLWECNSDGTGMNRIGLLFSAEPSTGNPTNTSSAGDWVTFSIGDTKEIYIVKRDGTELKNVGEGTYPDFSPDASKIVYQKDNQGIWIMNRDGTGKNQIVVNENAMQPAWSPQIDTIAYCYLDTLYLIDTLGVNHRKYYINQRNGGPDWSSTIDTVSMGNGLDWNPKLLSLVDGKINSLDIIVGGFARWAPDGKHFIGYDADGYFIISRNGANKWYLKP